MPISLADFLFRIGRNRSNHCFLLNFPIIHSLKHFPIRHIKLLARIPQNEEVKYERNEKEEKEEEGGVGEEGTRPQSIYLYDLNFRFVNKFSSNSNKNSQLWKLHLINAIDLIFHFTCHTKRKRKH